MCLHEFMCTMCIQVLAEARGHLIPWSCRGCKLPDVGAGTPGTDVGAPSRAACILNCGAPEKSFLF